MSTDAFHLPSEVRFFDAGAFEEDHALQAASMVLVLTDGATDLFRRRLARVGTSYREHTIESPLGAEGVKAAVEAAKAAGADLIVGFGNVHALAAAKLTARLAREAEGHLDAWYKSRIAPPCKQRCLKSVLIPTNVPLTGAFSPRVKLYDAFSQRYVPLLDKRLFATSVHLEPDFLRPTRQSITRSAAFSIVRALDVLVSGGDMTRELSLSALHMSARTLVGSNPLASAAYADFLLEAVPGVDDVPFTALSEAVEGLYPEFDASRFATYAGWHYLRRRLHLINRRLASKAVLRIAEGGLSKHTLEAALEGLFERAQRQEIDTLPDIDPSECVVQLKAVDPYFDALSDETLYEILTETKGGR